MKMEICICQLIPRIETATKIIVVVARREASAPTNTGRLASMALKNSALLVRGDLENPYDLSVHIPANTTPLVLFPAEEASVVNEDFLKSIVTPICLIVPDGNWRQANKMRRRDPHMAELRTIKLAPGTVSQYRVRAESQPEGLATIEAIARALGVIETPAVQSSLELIFHKMVSRTMASRGR